MTESPRCQFPWWVIVGAVVLAAGYLPTLSAPFDFIDDGNLVYPAPAGTTAAGFVERWWDRVRANVEHLGPFRPTLWAHWELFANTLNADPLAWRAVRLAWCGLAAGMLLWLLRELRLHPTAALIAAAAAMWNPYRNEIWTSLTLAEGVAMPYALLALVAARKASAHSRPWGWDAAAAFGLFVALGCKNTFVALVPAMLALRLLPDGSSLRDGWRAGRWAAGLYLLPLAMPAAHFAYFKWNWHPGQYETPGPSLGQLLAFTRWMRGAVGLDFLGAGLALVALVVWLARRAGGAVSASGLGVLSSAARPRAAVVCGVLLLVAGTAVYMPLPMVAARYTMPAVWGADVLFATLLTAFVAVPLTGAKRVAWAGLAVGLAALAVANVGRQDRVAARSRMLWDALRHVEHSAPPGARLAWVSGDGRDALNVEEGIHFQWHLTHRGRADLRVMLIDESDRPIARAELPAADGPGDLRIAGSAVPTPPGWDAGRTFAVGYRLGTKAFACRVGEPIVPTDYLPADARLAALMKAAFEQAQAEAKLFPAQPGSEAATAELRDR